MINPREYLHTKYGKIPNGEQQVYNKLKRIRDGVIPYEGNSNLNGHLVPMDSLLESAFNTGRNEQWQSYFMSAYAPDVTQQSQEQHLLLHACSELDKETSRDKFSSIDDEGDNLSENYSSVASSQLDLYEEMQDFKHDMRKPDEHVLKYNSTYYDKFCFFKIINGLKLPMLYGEKDQRYNLMDVINFSTA